MNTQRLAISHQKLAKYPFIRLGIAIFLLLAIPFIPHFPANAEVPGLLIDDFNDGADPNELGGTSGTFSSLGAYCGRTYYNQNLENVLGGVGYSMKLRYDTTRQRAYSGLYCLLGDLNATAYKTLSFWVKGESGGEIFKVGLNAGEREIKIPITDYLLHGVTAEWQKVDIPLAAFRNIVVWHRLYNFSITFEDQINSGSGTVYIDDVKLDKRDSPLFVDNFNDDIPQNALDGNLWTVCVPGATISTGYETTNPYGETGQSYYITYDRTGSNSDCEWVTGLNGVDVLDKSTLSFYIRGDNGYERPNVYFLDGLDGRNFINIEDYIQGGRVTTDWQKVNIPLSDFLIPNADWCAPIDFTDLRELSFVFEWEIMFGTIYLDDIAFIKDDTPPLVSLPYPADGDISASPIVTLIISDGLGLGVDENTIQLEVEGATYDISSLALEYDSQSETLTFTPHKVRPDSLVFTDGQIIDVSLLTVSDKAGNSIPEPYSWFWEYDVDLDITPPEPPTILSPESNINNPGITIFEWISYDASGMAGYSFILDRSIDTIVDENSEGMVTQEACEFPGGRYYFHVAAVDVAGNWSRTTHFELTDTLLVDDFNDGAKPNSLDGDSGTFDCDIELASFCNSTYINNANLTLGGRSYSLQLDYNISSRNSFAGYWTAFNHMDLSRYQALSLWVKGARGGEVFNVKFEDSLENVSEANITYYSAGGVTTSWQKVIIPLSIFTNIVAWDRMDSLIIVFEGAIGSTAGTVYIDQIELLANYLPIDNFDAARPQGQVPYGSDIKGVATIVVGYDSSDAYGGSGHSLKIDYTVAGATPATYCVWMRGLGGMDVSGLNMLGFYAKGASDGEYFNVYLNNGVGMPRAGVDIRNYLTLRDDWHYVKIPLADFVDSNPALDLTDIESLEIVFEWEDMQGIVYIDNIEFTNGLFKEPSRGPVRVSGSNLLVHGKTFPVKGVGYQPTPIGYYPYNPGDGSPYIDVFKDTPYNRDMWERDLEYLRDMNCNTIRTWGKVTSTAFLDACYNGGVDPMYVLMGIYIDNKIDYSIPKNKKNRIDVIDDFAEHVRTYKDHPAVLMWAVGNEDNYWYGGGIWNELGEIDPDLIEQKREKMKEFFTLVNELARTAYEIEGPAYHPVTFPNGDLYYIGDDIARASDTAMNYLDIWSVNAFRGSSFGDLFTEYQSRSTKPLLISEFGIDAWDDANSVEYKDTQANYATTLWNEVMENPNICIGATIMEYSDEWHKDDDAGSSIDTHDYGGYPTNSHPDGFSNEEWWGIMETVDNGAEIDIMEPRQAYYDMKERWTEELLIDGFNDGTDPNELGGAMGVAASGGAAPARNYYNYTQTYALGGSGYSLRIDYDVTIGRACYYSLLQNLDAREYNTLSLWVKGEAGGEIFKIGLKDANGNESEILLTDYLPNGVTTEWQKLALPIAAFKDITERDRLDKFSIVFEEQINSGSGAIYVDDIKLEIEWVPYCAWTMELGGIDVFSKDTLSFDIKGGRGGEKPHVYLCDGSNCRFADIRRYGTVYTNWKRFNIPLSDFSEQGIDLTHLTKLSFVFEWSGMSGAIFVDNVTFVTYSDFIMPTLNLVPEAMNMSPIFLWGNKAPRTGIFINGTRVAEINESTDWSYDFPLVDGPNVIRLTARDANNNSSAEIITSVVLDAELPQAYAGPDRTAFENEVISFDGSLSRDNYEIGNYIWNFGDGSPEENGIHVTHIYTTPAAYTATLTVYDLAGNGPVSDEAVITVEDDNVIKIGGPDPDYDTIQEGIDNASAGDTIYISPGEYEEDITIPGEKTGIIIKGQNQRDSIMKGNISLTETNATIRDLSIFYGAGDYLSFTNEYYDNFRLLANAGITAINSEVSVENCFIKPDPDIFTVNYGKGIQIWNMYNTPEILPHIEGNLIKNTECAIYYFSQAFGGAIYGEIKNNTFHNNKNGILLRMHKENPHIYNNIFDNCPEVALYHTYENGDLFNQRKVNISNNLFNLNSQNFWLDSLQAPFDLIGIQENIEDDPLFIAPGLDNFHLQPGSPALTGGEEGSLMGAYAIPPYELFIEITSHADGETIYAEP